MDVRKNFSLTEEVNYGVMKLFKLNLYILYTKLLWAAFRTEQNLSRCWITVAWSTFFYTLRWRKLIYFFFLLYSNACHSCISFAYLECRLTIKTKTFLFIILYTRILQSTVLILSWIVHCYDELDRNGLRDIKKTQ